MACTAIRFVTFLIPFVTCSNPTIMSKKKFLLSLTLLVCMAASAQHQKPVYRFPLQPGQQNLNTSQQNLADSLYDHLADGQSLRLNLLSPAEEALDRNQRSQISFQRAALLMNHYRNSGLPERAYCAEFVPYEMPNVVRTNDLTRASSISMGRKSQTHVCLTRQSVQVTARASVNFDTDFSKELQQFNFYASNGVVAYLPSGTTITIPAGSLCQANGQEPDCQQVTLRVSEYLDLEAMALKAMTTTSSNKKLQTAGMWYIDVVCNGKQLAMKPDQKYMIHVNTNGEVKDMKVFTGHEKNGLLDWKEETDDRVIKPGEKMTGAEDETNEEYNENWEGEGDGKKYMLTEQLYFQENNQYGLQLNNFGWINCDAFDETQQLTDLMVRGEIDENTNVMLVYGKRKSVLPGYLCEDKKSVKFSKIATDETAMLVVFKKTDDKGNVERYTQVVQPGLQTSIGVNLTPSTTEILRNEIKGKLSDL